MKKFFHNPYDIRAYGRLPDFINTSLYFVDFRKISGADPEGGKLFLKDPVVDGLQELYPISHGAHIEQNNIISSYEGEKNIEKDYTLLSFNGCIPFHVCYSIMNHLNLNNNYPILIPRREKDIFSEVNIDLYTNYWMKKGDEKDIKHFIQEGTKKMKVESIRTSRPLTGYIPYYGLFSATINNGNIEIYNKKCPVERYLGYGDETFSIYRKRNNLTTGEFKDICEYVMWAYNIPYYNSRYLIDKIRHKNILEGFKTHSTGDLFTNRHIQP